MARVLARLRISKDTDSSTAIEGQRRDITRWAELHGHDIVGWAIDENVSGAIDPFKAPGLAPWFAEDKVTSWDTLVSWKLDRLGRGLFDLNDLFKWALAHGKSIASVMENIDISTAVGRMVATLLAGVAEMEREAMRTRINAERDRNRKNGNYHGGTPPYGYRPVKRDGKGWELIPDPVTSEVTRGIFEQATQQSIRSICRDLNAKGVPGPKGGEWFPETITNMIRARYPLGYVEHDGQLVIGDDGTPVRREPLVSDDLHDRANKALSERRRPPERKNDTALLAGVLFCQNCQCEHLRKGTKCPIGCPGKAPLYAERIMKRGKEYGYYRCKNRCPSLNLERMDASVYEDIMMEIGDIERVQRVRVSGENDQVVRDLTQRIKDLFVQLVEPGSDSAGILEETARLNQELAAARSVGDSFEVHSLGETYREAWDRLSTVDRRSLLVDSGIRVHIKREGNMLVSNIIIDEKALSEKFPGYVPYDQRPKEPIPSSRCT